MAELNSLTFCDHTMDFLRHVRAHAGMLRTTSRHIPEGSSVLDLGCGIGLLTEHLPAAVPSYLGIDVSSEFIAICKARYGGRQAYGFFAADAGTAELPQGAFDTVTILNLLNLPGIQPLAVLRRGIDSLRPGGRLIVSGPKSKDSWSQIESQVLGDLKVDGKLDGREAEIRGLLEANQRLVTEHGNYWSVEGMVALLSNLGCGAILATDPTLYYGASYLVVAQK